MLVSIRLSLRMLAPLKLSIPKFIPQQVGELHSELDVGPGVSCAAREGVGD